MGISAKDRDAVIGELRARIFAETTLWRVHYNDGIREAIEIIERHTEDQPPALTEEQQKAVDDLLALPLTRLPEPVLKRIREMQAQSALCMEVIVAAITEYVRGTHP
jgi:hypothetical protein